MGECFANEIEIVQRCGKMNEIEVTKMGQNYPLFYHFTCTPIEIAQFQFPET